MILLRLRLRLGRHLSLSPALLLSLSPLVVRILTVSTVPFLSSEWGAREDLGVLVALAAWGVWVIIVPPPAVPPSPVSRHTPPTTMTFGHTTSLAQSRKRFLLFSPLQCWPTTLAESSRICYLGFHIALASVGVLGSLPFRRILVFHPTLGNPLGFV
jgi:hypothetical protein